ncbi:hypothetical protein HDV05_006818, partial [Chytridiales sp. JEL 0842]
MLGLIPESDVYDTYNRELLVLLESIQSKVQDAIPSASSDQKKLVLNQANREVEEAEEIVGQMELELASLSAEVRARLSPHLKSHKEELKKARKSLKQASQRDQLFAGGSTSNAHVVDMDGATQAQRDRLLVGTDRLMNSSKRLEETRRVAMETELMGIDTLNVLNNQREQILRTRDTLGTADTWITKSQGVLKTMQR